jgi:hypothetical protein
MIPLINTEVKPLGIGAFGRFLHQGNEKPWLRMGV